MPTIRRSPRRAQPRPAPSRVFAVGRGHRGTGAINYDRSEPLGVASVPSASVAEAFNHRQETKPMTNTMTTAFTTRAFAVAAITAVVALPATTFAQAGANPFTDAVKGQFAQIRNSVTRTAEKVPEDVYAFKPTPEVRSLGQLVAHIADGNNSICGAASGMKPTGQTGIEKSVTGKAALQKALADSFAFCEQAMAAMDDAKGAEMTKFMGMQPRLMVLAFNNSHLNEHYGNLVTYMRLKGIVPPSSEPK